MGSWDIEPTNVISTAAFAVCAIVAKVTTNDVELHWFAKFSAHKDVFMWPFIIRTAVAPGTTHWRHGTMWRPRRGPTCGVGDSSCRSQCCSTTAMHSSIVCLWFARAAMAHDNPQPQPAEGCIGRVCQVELAAVAAEPPQNAVPLKLRFLHGAWNSSISSNSSCTYQQHSAVGCSCWQAGVRTTSTIVFFCFLEVRPVGFLCGLACGPMEDESRRCAPSSREVGILHARNTRGSPISKQWVQAY